MTDAPDNNPCILSAVTAVPPRHVDQRDIKDPGTGPLCLACPHAVLVLLVPPLLRLDMGD
jgi:hypothetical protein